jgi:YfiH family protein
MRSAATGAWRERSIDGDRALVRDLGPATAAFARGPTTGEPDRSRRLARLIDALPAPLRSISHCRQTHSAVVHSVRRTTNRVVLVGDGDGLVTDQQGHGLLVWTADCVPVLLVGNRTVAAVHSGWRGAGADVVGAAMTLMEKDFNADPSDVHAVLGPAVCGRCYEVGPDVPAALSAFGLDEGRWRDGDHVDLRGFLTARLEALGVFPDRIETVGGCTVESSDLASFRRDGEAAGRQWSMVFLNG